jgi:alpha-ribazole phosphatase
VRLFLVRHPAPLVAPGICYGRTDLLVEPTTLAVAAERLRARLSLDPSPSSHPAAPSGRGGADAHRTPGSPARHPPRPLVEPTAGPFVGLCLTSPLRRCADLAAAVCPDPRPDDRLLELDFGHWEGRRWDDIDRAELDRWAEDPERCAPPGGETWETVRERCRDLLDELRLHDRGPVLAVTHAGVVRAVLALVLGVELAATWHIRLSYGALAIVDLGAGPAADRLVGLDPGVDPS